MSGPVKVVYITGAGRSGSTVLDTVLGNHPDIESVGELMHAPRAWANRDEYCACGEKAGDCPFWLAVREAWKAALPKELQGANWPTLQAEFERPRYLLRILQQRTKPSRHFQLYNAGVTALYRAIQTVSGKTIIADSSKNPVRALALTCIPEIDLKLIHLVRDGRGVAWSLHKPYKKDPEKGIQHDIPGKPVARTALFWRVANTLSEVAMKRAGDQNKLRLRYEDFIANPGETLHRIGGVAGLDFESVIEQLESERDFEVGHTIAGNRLRMAGKIQLKADLEWQEKLNPMQKRIFWLIAGGMASRYDYPRSG